MNNISDIFIEIRLILKVLKPAWTILLVIVILIQAFGKWFVMLEYEINKDYIAKNLCVNRAMPSLYCKGKCFLQKKLANEEDQQQPGGNSSKQENGPVELFLYQAVQVDFRLPSSMHEYNFGHLNGKSQEFIRSFFQLPQC